LPRGEPLATSRSHSLNEVSLPGLTPIAVSQVPSASRCVNHPTLLPCSLFCGPLTSLTAPNRFSSIALAVCSRRHRRVLRSSVRTRTVYVYAAARILLPAAPLLCSGARVQWGRLSRLSLTRPAWLACTTAADIIIATCILTGLLRSKTGCVLLLYPHHVRPSPLPHPYLFRCPIPAFSAASPHPSTSFHTPPCLVRSTTRLLIPVQLVPRRARRVVLIPPPAGPTPTSSSPALSVSLSKPNSPRRSSPSPTSPSGVSGRSPGGVPIPPCNRLRGSP
jgi:hypothetical protein